MSAVLSPQFAENFGSVGIKETFSEKEREDVEALEKRKQPPEGEPTCSCNTNLFFGLKQPKILHRGCRLGVYWKLTANDSISAFQTRGASRISKEC